MISIVYSYRFFLWGYFRNRSTATGDKKLRLWQQIFCNCNTSGTITISAGIPQGCILGPLPYTLYTSQCHKQLKNSNYYLYAGDSRAYYSIDMNNSDIANVGTYRFSGVASGHLLTINSFKSSVILFEINMQRDTVRRRLNADTC